MSFVGEIKQQEDWRLTRFNVIIYQIIVIIDVI